jgi:glyoxylase-like metal-dependent hydrolase (beta-lactamase superfamily II)
MRLISCLAIIVAVAAATFAARPGTEIRQGTEVVRTADINARGLKPTDFPRITKLTDGVYAYEQIDPTKRIVTANNLIVVTSEGVLVAEGQGTVENVKRLVADIAMLTPQPIKFVVAGSEHGDHTGGYAAFPASAAVVVHPFSKAAIERRINRPAETVAEKRVISLGGMEIDVLFLGRAHTGGDLEVYLPRQRVLFMSEVFSNRIFPSMANGFPTEWIETLKKAEQMDAAVYVPAHGFIDSPTILKEEERNYRSALERVMAEGRRLHDQKVPVDDAASKADFGPFATWTRRSENAAGALKRVYMELDGELPKQ